MKVTEFKKSKEVILLNQQREAQRSRDNIFVLEIGLKCYLYKFLESLHYWLAWRHFLMGTYIKCISCIRRTTPGESWVHALTHTHTHTHTHTYTRTHTLFCVAKRKKGNKGEKKSFKAETIKGCHQGQNVTVLAILEYPEFKNFSCRPTMVVDNTFQCSMAPTLWNPFHRLCCSSVNYFLPQAHRNILLVNIPWRWFLTGLFPLGDVIREAVAQRWSVSTFARVSFLIKLQVWGLQLY